MTFTHKYLTLQVDALSDLRDHLVRLSPSHRESHFYEREILTPFTKTLTLTGTPTTLADLVAGVTNGTGASVNFRGKLIVAGGTVTLTTASGSASLPTGSNVDIQADLKLFSASGNTFTVTLVGQADALPINLASDLD